MNVNDLNNYFDNLNDELQKGLDEVLPDLIGIEAVNHFKDGFQNEGFTDKSLEKWTEVKRRKGNGKGADILRKILTGKTGNLHDSINYDIEPERVVISANPMNTGAGSNYAAAHNFGTANAGRNHNTVIPRRKFLDHSQMLNQKIIARIERYINAILKI